MTTVLFILRKTRSKSSNSMLYCRVTVNSLNREFSTEEIIPRPDLWDQDKQIYNDPREAGAYINFLVDKIRYKLKLLTLQLAEAGDVSPEQIIEKYREPNKKAEPVATPAVKDLVQKYIVYEKEESALEEGAIKLNAGTIKHHERYLKNLLEYEGTTGVIHLNEFDVPAAERFKRFLRERPYRPCRHKTRASRHIEFFKKAFDYAIKDGLIKEHGLLYYQGERDRKKKNMFLEHDERQAWINSSFDDKLLSECLDLGTYQMVTGVEYGNIWGKFEVKDIPGVGKIIMGTRNKGDKHPFYLPYDPIADRILQKYKGKLPRHCNSTYNKVIKIITEILRMQYPHLFVNKKMTTHIFRKTFNMWKKAEGWSLQARADMLGHATTRTTETHYEDSTPEIVINEMIARAQLRKFAPLTHDSRSIPHTLVQPT
jgi:site-specific recombinase XerD